MDVTRTFQGRSSSCIFSDSIIRTQKLFETSKELLNYTPFLRNEVIRSKIQVITTEWLASQRELLQILHLN